MHGRIALHRLDQAKRRRNKRRRRCARVVKGLDSKSNDVSPQRFEACRLRIILSQLGRKMSNDDANTITKCRVRGCVELYSTIDNNIWRV